MQIALRNVQVDQGCLDMVDERLVLAHSRIFVRVEEVADALDLLIAAYEVLRQRVARSRLALEARSVV